MVERLASETAEFLRDMAHGICANVAQDIMVALLVSAFSRNTTTDEVLVAIGAELFFLSTHALRTVLAARRQQQAQPAAPAPARTSARRVIHRA